MIKVLFVGSNPSAKNKDPLVPFLDTRSGDNLRTWIKFLNVTCYRVINVSDKVTPNNRPLLRSEINYDMLRKELQGDFLFVALGNTASYALTKLGKAYFKLPHPSPKNRKLNDGSALIQTLHDCKVWLEDQKGS